MVTWQPGVTLDDLERDAITKALKFYGGNKTHTANALGIALRTLREKIKAYAKSGKPIEGATIDEADKEK